MWSRRRAATAVIAAAAAMLLLAGCGSVEVPYANNGLPKVGYLGDSLGVQLQQNGELVQALSNDDVGFMTGTGNQTDGTPYFLNDQWLTNLGAPSPTAVIVNLGTNDAQKLTDDDMPAVIGRLANMRDGLMSSAPGFGGTSCVIFVTINSHNPSWGPAHAVTINGWIRTQPRVVDWDSFTAHWTGEPLFGSTDNPHPNAAGRSQLSALIKAQVQTCPPARPLPPPAPTTTTTSTTTSTVPVAH